MDEKYWALIIRVGRVNRNTGIFLFCLIFHVESRDIFKLWCHAYLHSIHNYISALIFEMFLLCKIKLLLNFMFNALYDMSRDGFNSGNF
jgi:hypothetical protein